MKGCQTKPFKNSAVTPDIIRQHFVTLQRHPRLSQHFTHSLSRHPRHMTQGCTASYHMTRAQPQPTPTSRDTRLHSLISCDPSTASAVPSHERNHAMLAIGRESTYQPKGGADRGGEEGDQKIDPRGITKRLYVEAESSLRGKTDVSEWTAPQRAEHPTTSNKSRHPVEI